MKYSEQFKKSIIKQYHQSGMSAMAFSKRVGIDRETLRRWSTYIEPDAKTLIDSKYLNKNIHDKDKDWSTIEKYNAVLDYESLISSEQGKFLRKNGLYQSNVQQWKNGQELLLGTSFIE